MRRRLVLAIVCVNLLVLGFLVVRGIGWAAEGHRALCGLRHERVKSVADAEKFLGRNPNGGLGFTPTEIRKGIRDQKTTLRALRDVNC